MALNPADTATLRSLMMSGMSEADAMLALRQAAGQILPSYSTPPEVQRLANALGQGRLPPPSAESLGLGRIQGAPPAPKAPLSKLGMLGRGLGIAGIPLAGYEGYKLGESYAPKIWEMLGSPMSESILNSPDRARLTPPRPEEPPNLAALFGAMSSRGGQGLGGTSIPLPSGIDFDALQKQAPKARLLDSPTYGRDEKLNAILGGLSAGAGQVSEGAPLGEILFRLGAGALGGVTSGEEKNKELARAVAAKNLETESRAEERNYDTTLKFAEAKHNLEKELFRALSPEAQGGILFQKRLGKDGKTVNITPQVIRQEANSLQNLLPLALAGQVSNPATLQSVMSSTPDGVLALTKAEEWLRKPEAKGTPAHAMYQMAVGKPEKEAAMLRQQAIMRVIAQDPRFAETWRQAQQDAMQRAITGALFPQFARGAY